MRGYFGIGIYHPTSQENIGTLWRHAYIFDAAYIFTIGNSYKKQPTDTLHAYRHIPLYFYETFEQFYNTLPQEVELVGIEMNKKANRLHRSAHPQRAVYLLGSEFNGLPEEIQNKCDFIVDIYTPKNFSMNVATTGSLVMYDRLCKYLWDQENKTK